MFKLSIQLMVLVMALESFGEALVIGVKDYKHFEVATDALALSRESARLLGADEPVVMDSTRDGTALYPFYKNLSTQLEAQLKKVAGGRFYLIFSGQSFVKGTDLVLAVADTSRDGEAGLSLSELAKMGEQHGVQIRVVIGSALTSDLAKVEADWLRLTAVIVSPEQLKSKTPGLSDLLAAMKDLSSVWRERLYGLDQAVWFGGAEAKPTVADLTELERRYTVLKAQWPTHASQEAMAHFVEAEMLHERNAGETDEAMKYRRGLMAIERVARALAKHYQLTLDEGLNTEVKSALKKYFPMEFERILKDQQSAVALSKGKDAEQAVTVFQSLLTDLGELKSKMKERVEVMLETAVAGGNEPMAKFLYEELKRIDPTSSANIYKAGHGWANSLGMNFAYVPAGHYQMGSPEGEADRDFDEKAHEIELSAGVFMGVQEVSMGEWMSVVGRLPQNFEQNQPLTEALPVRYVSWEEAVLFCKKLSEKEGKTYRLPTEAEWEVACRAGTSGAFAVSKDERPSEGLFNYNSTGLKPSDFGATNPWGLRSMHGNVWEWCADWSFVYDTSVVKDPRGPSDKQAREYELETRVVRGGSWKVSLPHCRSANRWESSPAIVAEDIGFRVVLEVVN